MGVAANECKMRHRDVRVVSRSHERYGVKGTGEMDKIIERHRGMG